MRTSVLLIILFLLFTLLQSYAEDTFTKLVYPAYSPPNGPIYVKIIYPENRTTEIVEIGPVYVENKTICQIHGKWKLSFEITNTNPYTVFVAIPDTLWYYNKPLKYYEDFQKLYVSGVVAAYGDNDYTILNGKKGIWIPPYTTVKVHRHGIFVYNLNIILIPDKHEIVGPALMDTTSVFDEIFLEKSLRKYGVKVDNYKLLVNGKIVKIPHNTEVISMVIPAPLVLKDYDSFHKLLGKYDVDIWVDSYRKYVNKHKTISSRRYFELYNSLDDSLIPTMDNDLTDIGINLKLFDVPAMVFTTDDGETKSLEFSYIMYKY